MSSRAVSGPPEIARNPPWRSFGIDGVTRQAAGVALVAALVGIFAGLNPILALGAVLGLALVVLMLASVTAGVMVFTFVAFLELLPTLGGAPSTAKIVGLFLLIGWFLALISRRAEDRASRDILTVVPALIWTLAFFLVWVVFSLLWAEDVAVAGETFTRYALNFVLFPIVFAAIRTTRHVVWLFSVFVAGVLLSGVIGLVMSGAFGEEADRLSGAGINPNQLGALLAVGAVLAASLAFGGVSSFGPRFLALCSALLCIALAVMTGSRGALLGLVAALLVAPFVAGRGRRFGALIAVVAAILATAVYINTVAPEQVRDRLTHGNSSGSGRVDLWTVGLRMVNDKPVTGVGAGNFPVSSVHYLLQPGSIARDEYIIDNPKVTHNVYLQVLAELGVIGLGLFLTIIAMCLICAIRAARRFARAGERKLDLLARGLVIGLTALVVTDFFSSEVYSKQLYLLLATGPALFAIAGRSPAQAG